MFVQLGAAYMQAGITYRNKFIPAPTEMFAETYQPFAEKVLKTESSKQFVLYEMIFRTMNSNKFRFPDSSETSKIMNSKVKNPYKLPHFI